MNAVAKREGMAEHADWARFLKPVAAAVRNPPTEADFKTRVAAVAMSLPHIPAEWLRQPWRQAEAMRLFQFWPAVFDISQMFADDLKAQRESADMRGRLSAPKHIAEIDFNAAPEPTPEEIAEVKAKARAVMAEAFAPRPNDRTTGAKAAPVSDGVLLMGYEQAAANASTPDARRVLEFRADTLRKRMGVGA